MHKTTRITMNADNQGPYYDTTSCILEKLAVAKAEHYDTLAYGTVRLQYGVECHCDEPDYEEDDLDGA